MFNRCSCKNNMNYNPRMNMGCNPIIEPEVNNFVEKEFYYDVDHVIPVHTHVINRHIYNHTYRPEYSCSEENQIINNECGCNNNFLNR